MPNSTSSITKKSSILAAGLLLAFGLLLIASAPQQAMANDLIGGKVSTQNAIHAQSKAKVPSGAKSRKGHYYYAFNDSMTWSAAKKACAKRGGHLVTITSKAEQKFVRKIANNGANLYWIGYKADKNHHIYNWITGEKSSYHKWAKGEPNRDFNDNEFYVEMYAKDYSGSNGTFSRGEWNDACNDGGSLAFYKLENTGYICEWDNITTGVKASIKTPNSIGLTWSKQPGATKYQVRYKAKNGKWKKVISKSNSKIISKLKKGTSYTFKVRSYCKGGWLSSVGKAGGWGAWSAPKTAKTTR